MDETVPKVVGLARIAFDARSLTTTRRTGIENSSANLLRALAQGSWEHDLHFYFHHLNQSAVQLGLGHWKVRSYGGPAWFKMVVPFWLLRDRIDVMHLSSPVLPRTLPVKSILTVHDIMWEIQPDYLDDDGLRFHRRVVTPSIKRAHHLVAVSENTKQDLKNIYGIPANRISVVPHGVEARFRPLADAGEEVRRLHNLDGEFLLFVGTIKPVKNLGRILQAYSSLRAQGLREVLVIVGGDGWEHEAALRSYRDGPLSDGVRWLGFVPDEHLPSLYSAAKALVAPSLYEGFGLPLLEAMACGCPVIASNVASVPEVVGDAGMLVDPTDIDAIGDAIYRICCSEDWRMNLRGLSLERAAQFEWRRSAEKAIAVYDYVIGGGC